MQQNNRNVPDWLLERLALGELDAETAADVRRRLAAEGRSPDDIAAAVAASNREILAELPASQTAAEIRQRAAQAAAAAAPGAQAGDLPVGVPLALAGGLALTQLMWRPAHPDEGVVSRVGENPEIIIAKGDPDPRLYVYRHGAERQRASERRRARRARRSAAARVRRRGGGYGVAAVDRRRRQGDAALAREEERRAARRAEARARTACPRRTSWTTRPPSSASSWCSAATPFSVATAMEAARALAAQPSARKQALALPPGFEQISLALDKTHAAKKELP